MAQYVDQSLVKEREEQSFALRDFFLLTACAWVSAQLREVERKISKTEKEEKLAKAEGCCG